MTQPLTLTTTQKVSASGDTYLPYIPQEEEEGKLSSGVSSGTEEEDVNKVPSRGSKSNTPDIYRSVLIANDCTKTFKDDKEILVISALFRVVCIQESRHRISWFPHIKRIRRRFKKTVSKS